MHLKRLAAPKSYPIKKKGFKYTIKSRPGPHKKERSTPLLIVIRDILGIVETAREGRRVLNERKVLVDGVVRRDPKFPVGFMDVISIPAAGKHYRVLLDKHGRVTLKEIDEAEAKLKIVRVEKKHMTKGAKVQLTTHDGRNFLNVDAKPGDSLLIEIPSQKVVEVLKLEPGRKAYIIGGAHVGSIAEVKEIKPGSMTVKPRVVLKGDVEFETIKDYVFIVNDKVSL